MLTKSAKCHDHRRIPTESKDGSDYDSQLVSTAVRYRTINTGNLWPLQRRLEVHSESAHSTQKLGQVE